MSDSHRPPIDDKALDVYWDALVTDRQPSAQLPNDVTRALQRITSIDPAPQANSVRNSAWAETNRRIQRNQAGTGKTPVAFAASSNHHARVVMPTSKLELARSARWTSRVDRRWLAGAALLAAAIVALLVYTVAGPFGSDVDNGAVIPAVVDSTATPAGEHVLTIDLPASMVHSTGAISSAWEFTDFDGPVRWEYVPHCCPGPFVEYVLDGQFIVKNFAPMTVFRADGTTEAIPAETEVTLNTGDAFLAENDAKMNLRNPLRTDGHMLGWVLVNDERFDGHGGWAGAGIPQPFAADVQFDLQVSPGPGQLIVTRYDELDQIPLEAPNSHRFILRIAGNAEGTPIASSTIVPASGTPFPNASRDGYYVLDFLMSPAGTVPPAATPDA